MGFGCMGMSHAYGTVSTKEEAQALLNKAMDLGCDFFDTAEVYGTADDPHHNESFRHRWQLVHFLKVMIFQERQ